MDSAAFRRAGYEIIDQIADYHENIQEQNVRSEVEPGFLREWLPTHPPEESEAWDVIHSDVGRFIAPGITHWAHPGFMAYLPSSPTFEGILGELYTAGFNIPAFDWICSPSVTELENVVMDWLVQLLGLPEAFHSSSETLGGGIIMGSTTECLIAVMVAARDRMVHRRGEDVRSRLVVLGGSETHVSTSKAAAIVGVQYRSISCQPEGGIAMTEQQLRSLIDQCHQEGLVPFYLTATFGTTNVCATDDIAGIARVARESPDLWVHLDAAYAGSMLVCEEFRPMADGLDEFESVSVNLCKFLLTTLDATALFVKHCTYLTDALQSSISILDNDISASGRVIDYRNWQLSMGRRFRALKIWFVLRSWGLRRIQQHVRYRVHMAQTFTSLIKSRPDLFRLATKPQFCLNLFFINHEAAQKGNLTSDEAAIKVLGVVNATKKIWLIKTIVSNAVAIRVISGNAKANLDTLHYVFKLLVKATESLDQSVNIAEERLAIANTEPTLNRY